MVGIRLLILAPLAFAAPLAKRADEGQEVYNAITGINNAVLELTSALNAYNGGILETKPVFDASIDIHNVNREGYAEAVSSSNFTQAESQSIVNHVSNSVGITIPAGLKVLEAKKPLFDAANVTSLVEATILLLKNDHETFSEAVGSKLTPAEVTPGLIAAGKIDAALQAAALYYAV